MKKFMAFIFSLLMAFVPVFGTVRAEGEPQGKNKTVCDELWQNVKTLVSTKNRSEIMYMDSGSMTEEARKVFDKYGAEYQICRIIYKNGEPETVLLISQEESGYNRAYVCDFFTAVFINFFHYDKVEDAGREFLFKDADEHFRDTVRIGKDATIGKIEYFDKTGKMIGTANVKCKSMQETSACDDAGYDALGCYDSGY